MSKTKPVAVIISDIHFTVSTLELASAALLRAQFTAKMLNVPLIIAGDTLDSKAIIRAEVANKLLRMLSVKDKTPTYMLVGNHDLCNEKGTEHSLNFLHGFCEIVDRPHTIDLGGEDVMLMPYQSDPSNFKTILADEDTSRTIITHQGLRTAYMGHYVTDKTSLPPETFDGYRVISGHYHRHQDIKCGKTGLFSYVGNPYTLTFGEADDGPKGFCVLHSDGVLELIPTNLRKHVVIERDINVVMDAVSGVSPEDLVWLKITGSQSELAKLSKKEIGARLFGHSNFKLDLIPTSSRVISPPTQKTSESELMDNIIDALPDPVLHKERLKSLWRELV